MILFSFPTQLTYNIIDGFLRILLSWLSWFGVINKDNDIHKICKLRGTVMMVMMKFSNMRVRINWVSSYLYVGVWFLLLVDTSYALPMCTDSRHPFSTKNQLAFCSNNAYQQNGCCDNKTDSSIQASFQSMNVSDAACAQVLKDLLCSKCDQFSGDLFLSGKQDQSSVPILCNSARQNYCSHVWDECMNVPIFDSPFAPSLKGGSSGNAGNKIHTRLTDLWQSKGDFCKSFGGVSMDGNACFNGTAYIPMEKNVVLPPQGICLEKVGNGTYLSMIPHPDGSNKVFLGTQTGEVYLATLPDEDSSGPMQIDESKPFIDLSDRLHSDSDFGLMGLAFHPDFDKNGRFFASFNCDNTKNPSCSGRCACNADANCDPSQIAGNADVTPCQYYSVIAEYTVNGSSTSPAEAPVADPTEVRRIFTMGLPFRNHHGGQIVFGPADKYLYFMMGDGGNRGDPFNFAQNKKSLLGKIMRLDVDHFPASMKTDNYLWGNYSIPSDNPYIQDKDLLPEIWALGLRNPWRCSFDSLKPSYFYCADVGQEVYEEVDLITKGGNYGWRVYEGADPFSSPWSPGGNTSANSIKSIFPVMGYDHKSIDPKVGSASIIGGYVVRSKLDPCLNGRYLYADLFGSIWAGTENPIGSGNFTTLKLSYNCSPNSPFPCTYAGDSESPTLKWILSFGEDNKKNVYILTATGVYKIGHPTDCNFACKGDVVNRKPSSPQSSPIPSPTPSSSFSIAIMKMKNICILLLLSLLILALS